MECEVSVTHFTMLSIRIIIYLMNTMTCLLAILVLYLTRKLYYDDDTATVIYHGFTFSVYLLCLLGAIISDSWLGKFRTILYLSIIYSIGSGVLAVSAIPNLDLPVRWVELVGTSLVPLRVESRKLKDKIKVMWFVFVTGQQHSWAWRWLHWVAAVLNHVWLHSVVINSNCPNNWCRCPDSSPCFIFQLILDLCFRPQSHRFCGRTSTVSANCNASRPPLVFPVFLWWCQLVSSDCDISSSPAMRQLTWFPINFQSFSCWVNRCTRCIRHREIWSLKWCAALK